MHHGFAYGAGHTLTPALPLAGGATFLRHPITQLLHTQVPRKPVTARKPQPDRVVSIMCLALVEHTRVREYQPVIHRLRLSASP
jgi:hypothetical protein